jgi:hypothetical protein
VLRLKLYVIAEGAELESEALDVVLDQVQRSGSPIAAIDWRDRNRLKAVCVDSEGSGLSIKLYQGHFSACEASTLFPMLHEHDVFQQAIGSSDGVKLLICHRLRNQQRAARLEFRACSGVLPSSVWALLGIKAEGHEGIASANAPVGPAELLYAAADLRSDRRALYLRSLICPP